MQKSMGDSQQSKETIQFLIVDDEQIARNLLRTVLQESGYTLIDEVESGQDALDAMRRKTYHLVLLDKNMPGLDGLQVLEHGKQIQPGCEFIIITAYGSLDSVIKAMDLGAHSYITKPFPALADVIRKVESAIKKVQVREENDALLGRLRAVREDLQGVKSMLPDGPAEKKPRTNEERVSDIQRTIDRLRSLEEIVELRHTASLPEQEDD